MGGLVGALEPHAGCHVQCNGADCKLLHVGTVRTYTCRQGRARRRRRLLLLLHWLLLGLRMSSMLLRSTVDNLDCVLVFIETDGASFALTRDLQQSLRHRAGGRAREMRRRMNGRATPLLPKCPPPPPPPPPLLTLLLLPVLCLSCFVGAFFSGLVAACLLLCAVVRGDTPRPSPPPQLAPLAGTGGADCCGLPLLSQWTLQASRWQPLARVHSHVTTSAAEGPCGHHTFRHATCCAMPPPPNVLFRAPEATGKRCKPRAGTMAWWRSGGLPGRVR